MSPHLRKHCSKPEAILLLSRHLTVRNFSEKHLLGNALDAQTCEIFSNAVFELDVGHHLLGSFVF